MKTRHVNVTNSWCWEKAARDDHSVDTAVGGSLLQSRCQQLTSGKSNDGKVAGPEKTWVELACLLLGWS